MRLSTWLNTCPSRQRRCAKRPNSGPRLVNGDDRPPTTARSMATSFWPHRSRPWSPRTASSPRRTSAICPVTFTQRSGGTSAPTPDPRGVAVAPAEQPWSSPPTHDRAVRRFRRRGSILPADSCARSPRLRVTFAGGDIRRGRRSREQDAASHRIAVMREQPGDQGSRGHITGDSNHRGRAGGMRRRSLADAGKGHEHSRRAKRLLFQSPSACVRRWGARPSVGVTTPTSDRCP